LRRASVATSPSGTVASASGAPRHERCDQPFLRLIRERNVEQDEPAPQERAAAVLDRASRRAEKHRPIDARYRLELFLESFEETRQIAADIGERAERRCRHARQRQLLERARERAWKAGHRGNRGKIGQTPIGCRVEERARRYRLHAKRGRWRHAIAREPRRRQPRRQLREAESIQTERGSTTAARNVAREIIGRPARSRDDQRFSGGRRIEQELAGGLNPDRRRRGGDDLQHLNSLPDAVPGTRDDSATLP
jgi:hypothetical protein